MVSKAQSAFTFYWKNNVGRGYGFFIKELCHYELLGRCNQVGINVIYTGVALPLRYGDSYLIIKHAYTDTIVAITLLYFFVLHLS